MNHGSSDKDTRVTLKLTTCDKVRREGLRQGSRQGNPHFCYMPVSFSREQSPARQAMALRRGAVRAQFCFAQAADFLNVKPRKPAVIILFYYGSKVKKIPDKSSWHEAETCKRWVVTNGETNGLIGRGPSYCILRRMANRNTGKFFKKK